MLFSSKEIMTEVSRREKEAKIVPDPDIDTYMKVHKCLILCLFFLSPENMLINGNVALYMQLLSELRPCELLNFD